MKSWASFNHLRCERGNIFAMLFGAVALVGVLGAVSMQALTGPVTTVTRVTQRNIAENNLLMDAKILVNAAVGGVAGGDPDGDGIIEPAEFVAPAGGETGPVNGGFLPLTLGLSLTDPWGTKYGYCVWDHGTTNSSTKRLTGDNTASASIQPVIAIIAAGPDKQFQTTCSAYAGGPVQVTKSSGSDDLIFSYTYAEATASSNGLWTLNTSDQSKAELKNAAGSAVSVSINRDTGIGDFLGITTSIISAKSSDTVALDGGLLLDSDGGGATTCTATEKGSLRLNADRDDLELCDGAGGWVEVRTPPGGSAGHVQFNDGAGGFAGDGNLYWDNSAKRLGIGGTPSAYTLDVTGTFGASGNTVIGGTLGVTSAATFSDTMDVLGATTLSDTLDIAGNVAVNTDKLTVDAATGNTAIAGTLDVTGATTLGNTLLVTGATTLSDMLGVTGATTLGDTLDVAGNTTIDANTLFVDSTANTVGIGTTSPAAKLDIVGGVKIGADAVCSASKTGMIAWNSPQLQICDGTSFKSISAIDRLDDIGDVEVPTPNNDDVLAWDDENSKWIAKNIALLGPAQVDVAGNDGDIQFRDGNDLGADPLLHWDNTSKRLGVGTTSPQYALDVAGEMRLQASNSLRFTNAISILADTTFNGSNGIPIRIGKSATATNADSIAIGTNTNAVASSVVVGSGATSSGLGVAVGQGASALLGGIAVGGNAVTSGDGSGIAIGSASRATSGSVAIGLSAGSSTFSGIAMGRQSALTGNNQFVAGGTGGNALSIANVFFGSGPKSTTPLDYTINGSGADGTDLAGGHLSLAGGRNTGAGAPGDVRILTATVGASGTAQQALATRLTVKGGTGNVGIGTATPSSSAALEVASTASGFLPPRMTESQRNAISNPATGLIIFNTTTNFPNFYDGTGWSPFFSPMSGPISFGFVNQTGVPTSNTVTSNAVTLTGFPGTLTATCANCTAIARNGVWGGTVVNGFTAGDTIAIRVLSSAANNTPIMASATVGSTVSMPWTVTTLSASGPAPFSFVDIVDATTGMTYTSDAVTLTGFVGPLTATCTNCTAISRNGGAWGASPLSGFTTGDTIALRMNAGATPGGTVSTTVTIGDTTSTPWSITATNGCGVTAPGAICPDGTVVAGITADGNVLMYTTPCDAGMTWDSGTSTCTGTRLSKSWNNGSANWTVTGYTSPVTGLLNTGGLVTLTDAGGPYEAALYCANLDAYGHDDWYLPAKDELATFYVHRIAIGGFDGGGTYYWSASEINNVLAWLQRFSDGHQSSGTKDSARLVRCARR